jgi:hypothetical protein
VTTVKQTTFLSGQMAAQEFDIVPAAVAETRRALGSDLLIRVPGHRDPARIGFTNGGEWFTVEWRANRSVSCLTRNMDVALELVALAVSQGGHLNLPALAEAFRVTDIVTTIEWPDENSVELSDISAWVGAVLLRSGGQGPTKT